MEYKVSPGEGFSIWKKIIFVSIFLFITPIALGISLLSLPLVSENKNLKGEAKAYETQVISPISGFQVYASLPALFPSISGDVTSEDSRVGLIKKYLADNKSPLEPCAELIVQVSDKYELDYRLTCAIAQKESGLCNVIPEGSYNCWGWGVHSEGTLKFDSFEEGIEVVSKGLKENYVDQGYETIEEIMTKYAHPSSTTWAEGVAHYMNQIQD